jgi:hypothetical protein
MAHASCRYIRKQKCIQDFGWKTWRKQTTCTTRHGWKHLKWFLKNWNQGAWTVSIWLKIWTSGKLFCISNEPLGPITCTECLEWGPTSFLKRTLTHGVRLFHNAQNVIYEIIKQCSIYGNLRGPFLKQDHSQIPISNRPIWLFLFSLITFSPKFE